MNQEKSGKTWWRVSASLLLALLMAAPVGAQESTDSDTEDEDSAELGALEVTARLREESLLEVPVAVSVLLGDELEEVGAQDITYISQVVPNTTLEVSRGTTSTLTAFIRGVGQQDPVAGFESGVGIYLDGVYLNRPQGAVLDIYDVERIEVLRGPQGTLYGRNTIGGAVKYVTKRMNHDASADIEVSAGSYDQIDLMARGEFPVSDTFSIGAGVASFNRDGFGDNIFQGIEHYDKDLTAVRATAEWIPSGNFFLRISADYTDDQSNPRSGHRLIPGLLSGAPILDDVHDTRAGLTGRHESEQWGVQMQMEYDINPNWMLKSITAQREDENWQLIDFDSLPAEDVDVPAVYENEQFSQEFQLLFDTDTVQGVVGAYYLDASAAHKFDVLLATTGDLLGLPGLNAYTQGDVDTESWSIYTDVTLDLQAMMNLDTGLELTLGGRYTEDKRSARILRQTKIGGLSPIFGGAGVAIATTSDFNGSETFSEFTPKVSLAWMPTATQNLYVSYSQGFKGGSFDPRGLTTAAPDFNGDGTVSEDEVFQFMVFQPETVDTTELGLKSSFMNGRVSTNIAVFYSDYTDVQVPGSIGVDTDGDGISDTFAGVTTNAGAATVKGFEFEGSAILGEDMFTDGDAFSISWALGLIDAEYDEFITAVTDPATGSTALQDVADQRVFQNTPETTAHIGL